MSRFFSHLRRWGMLLFIVSMLLACSFSSKPSVSTSPEPEKPIEAAPTTEANQEQTATGETAAEQPDPLDHLLGLRSIRFNLIALYPEGASRSIQGEIDAAGNLHLKFPLPTDLLPEVPEGMDISMPVSDLEFYVVDGVGYQFDSETNRWVADSEPIDYQEDLANQLHGPEGPGLWLDLLPAGSLQAAGQEAVGGFTTKKSNVQGTLDGQTITGALWFDVESHALVQVELHVPAALLSISEETASGELQITLETQKAEIPDLTIPAPPTP